MHKEYIIFKKENNNIRWNYTREEKVKWMSEWIVVWLNEWVSEMVREWVRKNMLCVCRYDKN